MRQSNDQNNILSATYKPNHYTWAETIPPSWTQQREEEIELKAAGAYDSVLEEKRDAPNEAGMGLLAALNTYTSKFQQYFRENILGYHHGSANNLNQSSGKLLDGGEGGDRKRSDAQSINNDLEDDQPLNGSVNKKTGKQDNIGSNAQNPQGAPRNILPPPKPSKPNPIYLVYSILGCLSFATSGILRKYQGNKLFMANSIICVSFMLMAVFHFIYEAIKKRSKGEKYLFPWQFKGNTNFGEVVMTDKPLLFQIILGGFLEYVGAQAQVVSFNGAISAGMNGGLSPAVTACNTVFVLVTAYFMFGERITKIGFLAILCLLASVILVALFTPDIPNLLEMTSESETTKIANKRVDEIINQVITVDELTMFKV
jgi:multidrug transporter EmrE-like cation transporter